MVNVYYNEPTFDVDYTTNKSTPITANNRTTPVSDSDKHFEVEMQQWMNKKGSKFFFCGFFFSNIYHAGYYNQLLYFSFLNLILLI